MGLFNSKEKKYQKKLQKLENERCMLEEKYGLEILNDKDLEIVREIASNEKFSTKQNSVSSIIAFKLEDRTKINHLDILVKQNWLIIRQLAELNKKLDNK